MQIPPTRVERMPVVVVFRLRSQWPISPSVFHSANSYILEERYGSGVDPVRVRLESKTERASRRVSSKTTIWTTSSGKVIHRHFSPSCGSWVTCAVEARPDIVGLLARTSDEPAE